MHKYAHSSLVLVAEMKKISRLILAQLEFVILEKYLLSAHQERFE